MNQMEATMNLGLTFQMSLDSFIKESKAVNVNNYNMQKALEEMEKINQFRSWEKKKEIARNAISICPDCIDAYLSLGMYTKDLFEKLDILKRGMEKATINLGKDFFLQDIADFYTCENAHAFFQIKFAYALTLFECGYMKKSMLQFKELLNLNPSDIFKAHEFLYVLYLYFEELSLCKELMSKYQDHNTLYVYIMFLYEIKMQNYKNAQTIVPLMKESNPYLFDIITHRRMNMVTPASNYVSGGEEEASYIYNLLYRLLVIQGGMDCFLMNFEK